MFDTIAAIATSLNNNAISIIRISGNDSFEIINKIVNIDLLAKKANSISYAKIIYEGVYYDEILISKFVAPKSFTGENLIEINCHGGVLITRKIFSLILSLGIRIAMPGEFSKRAFLNNKISLSKAEAINELINAKNNIQIEAANKLINNSVSILLEPLIKSIVKLIATIEVNIDYPEYDDVEVLSENTVMPLLLDFINKTEEIINKSERFIKIKNGIKVAIVGKPNVGKSSLLNALIKKDKAIVSNIPGTTRDIIEGDLRLNNISLELIDTAGIRESLDTIENIGIQKSKEAIKEADLIFFLIDNSFDKEDEKILADLKDKKYIIINNKKDLSIKKDVINISALNNDLEELYHYLEEIYEDDIALVDDEILNNQRQLSLMIKAKTQIKEAVAIIKEGYELDLISDNLYLAYEALRDIDGKGDREDLIDELFKNFCLGK